MSYEDFVCNLTLADMDDQFSKSFQSLQLQLKTLLEEAGGDNALRFLDALCHLNTSEQKRMLSIFTSLVQRVAKGEHRLVTDDDAARQQFEDALYHDLVSALGNAALVPEKITSERKLSVVDGGRDKISSGPHLATVTSITSKQRTKGPKSRGPLVS